MLSLSQAFVVKAKKLSTLESRWWKFSNETKALWIWKSLREQQHQQQRSTREGFSLSTTLDFEARVFRGLEIVYCFAAASVFCLLLSLLCCMFSIETFSYSPRSPFAACV